jgi:transposase
MQAVTRIADKASMPMNASSCRLPPSSSRQSSHRGRGAVVAATMIAKLKQFHAIATRYDKTRRNFLAGIQLAATVIWLN